MSVLNGGRGYVVDESGKDVPFASALLHCSELSELGPYSIAWPYWIDGSPREFTGSEILHYFGTSGFLKIIKALIHVDRMRCESQKRIGIA